MTLAEYRKTLPWGDIIKWEKALAADVGVTFHAVQKWCLGDKPSPKHCKLIVKSKHIKGKVKLHDLRPDIW